MSVPQILLVTLLATFGVVLALELEEEGWGWPPSSFCPIKGQRWQKCKGCDGTCRNPNPACKLSCEPGCSCPQYASVVYKGRCIPPWLCPLSCRCPIEGQKFSMCKGCDGTCEEPVVPCLAICRPGCSCPVGTVVHEDKCTPIDECPQKPECPIEGQEFSECKGCDGSCSNPRPKCPFICLPGCSCVNVTYVVHEGKCIPPDECPACPIEGQTFKECKGCDGTCLNPYPVCPAICQPGCSCPPDTVVHKGKCIPIDECPECPIKGQTYKECKGCDGTCWNQNPICPLICVPGCSCDNGTVVHEGECVPTDECPGECCPQTQECLIEGQDYKECKGCDGTCLNPNPICPLICLPGCSCANFTYVVHKGKCIPPDECPECPIEGQILKECKGCDGTCWDQSPICPLACFPGCSCENTTYVVHKGKCIPPDECPVCPIEGQTFKECKGCDGTCWNQNPVCHAICEPGCSCPPDTVVHNGRCTPIDECPECPIEGQEYSECKGCDGTCDQPIVACPAICLPGCSCPAGTVVHAGKCITLEQCPVSTN